MKKATFILSLLLCLSLVSGASAQLTTISGMLSSPTEINATGFWGYQGFRISWNIVEQADHSWFYEYRLSDLNGNLYQDPNMAAVSHFTIEVSPNVGRDDFWNFSSGGDVEFGNKDGIASAMKMDWSSGVYSFYSNRSPVTGNFYAVDGQAGGMGLNSATNNDGYYIYRPDTENTMVPEPSTMILLASGLLGMGFRRRFRNKRK